MKNKIIVVEAGVRADRLTYFAQHHHILETADFRRFPSFQRMTIAQKEEYYNFCKKLDKEYVEQYICKPQYLVQRRTLSLWRNSMGKIIIEKYQDDFKEEWQKAHLNEQTPGYRLYKLRGTQFQQGDNGIIFFDSLNEEDLKLEKAQENYIFQEELYIVDRIYNEIGWEEFLSYRDNCYYKDMIKVFTDYYVQFLLPRI